MPRWFEGKVAIVTGGGSGIGRAAAIAFAKEGAKVVIGDVDVHGGEETAGIISQYGMSSFVKADVSKEAEAGLLVKKTVDYYGKLDYAFNNAGVEMRSVPIVDITESEWDRVIDVNVKGVWLCMKYEILQMLKLGAGAIVNTSSTGGLVGAPNFAAYTASKHAVIGLTKAASVEYAKTGIRINAVCPGGIETPMLERLKEHRQIGTPPMRRLGKPEEVANAVIWLCSEAASFITGHSLVVDGGYVAI